MSSLNATLSRRIGIEDYLAWSTVHGMAMLILDGPLRDRPRAEPDALGARLIDMVEDGLAAPARTAPSSGAARGPAPGRRRARGA